MEILQTVLVRGDRWRIVDLRRHDTGQVIALANGNRVRRVLTPFDDVHIVQRNDRPAPVSRRRWRHLCRAVIAADTPPGRLRTAARARIDLLPHQLEPALSVLRGEGSRLLLADDVGLGKTIQAGLVIAELLARRCIERVLILTPAGVRDQWAAELQRRFGICAAHADAASLRRLAATLPLEVNPWQTMPVAIASIDYFKRLEVLPAAGTVRWDVVVVDEAHASSADSERRDAVRLVAERAAYVILLTATPHNGDDAAFDRLCDIGSIRGVQGEPDDRIVVFRRTRQAIRGEQSRRVHVLRVRPSVSEVHMRDALDRYTRAIAIEHPDLALGVSILDKRALSSPWSLAQSVDRRLATLAEPGEFVGRQLTLPWTDPDGELVHEDEPPPWPIELALSDTREDQRLLRAISVAARGAAECADSKLGCLLRLLRRIRESILVFTEYRDTALHLRAAVGARALLLHGGLDRHERQAVIESFAATPGTILIATDAAGQGLNLHHTCRLVVNIELPWNPMRLEQRIGRVDRIGQTRRVHTVHFVAAGTSETAILARLTTRVARAQQRIGAPDPLRSARGSDSAHTTAPLMMRAPTSDEAQAEIARLNQVRTVTAAGERHANAVANDRPRLLSARGARLKTALKGRTLIIFQLTVEDADGRLAESRIVPLLVSGAVTHWASIPIPEETIVAFHRQAIERAAAFYGGRLRREQAIADRIAAHSLPAMQPALFDRRAEHAYGAAQRDRTDVVRAAAARVAAAGRWQQLGAPVARLLLVVRP